MFAVSNLYNHAWQPRVEKKKRREKGTEVKKEKTAQIKNKKKHKTPHTLYCPIFVKIT